MKIAESCVPGLIHPQTNGGKSRSGRNPRARLLIPLGYLHPGKREHSDVQSHPPLCNGRSTLDGFRRARSNHH